MSNALAKLSTWDDLATFVKNAIPVLREAKMQYLKGGLAIGAAIIVFADQPEIKAEVKKANQGRRGAPWKPYNFVAAMLQKTYGETIPSAKWLGDCARAAEIAQAKGLVSGDVHKLLGWADGAKEGIVARSAGIDEISPTRLLGYEPEGGANGKPIEFEKLIETVFDQVCSRIQHLVVQSQAKHKRLTHGQLKDQIEKVNEQLAFLGYRIAPVQRGGAKRK